MRALFYIPALCLASATAFPQDLPRVDAPPSAVCSIPLLSFARGNVDPLIVKKMPPANDRTPLVKVPAPPCDEPAAQPSDIAQGLREYMGRLKAVQPTVLGQRLLEQKKRLEGFAQKYSPGAKPPAENPEATPTPAP
jgi:hypothetical protein